MGVTGTAGDEPRAVAPPTAEEALAREAARREADEAAFHSVEAYCLSGVERCRAITEAAAALGAARNDVVAGYWRHVGRAGR